MPEGERSRLNAVTTASDLYVSVADLTFDAESWLLPGWIHRTNTLISGQPEAGKSTLAGWLSWSIAEGEAIFDAEPACDPGPVCVVPTDPGGDWEWWDRWHSRSENLHVVPSRHGPLEWDNADWSKAAGFARECGARAVVIDNLFGISGGEDLNQTSTIWRIQRHLSHFGEVDIPVVVIAHSPRPAPDQSDRSAPSRPLGSNQLPGMFRHRLELGNRGSSSTQRLNVRSNNAASSAWDLELRGWTQPPLIHPADPSRRRIAPGDEEFRSIAEAVLNLEEARRSSATKAGRALAAAGVRVAGQTYEATTWRNLIGQTVRAGWLVKSGARLVPGPRRAELPGSA